MNPSLIEMDEEASLRVDVDVDYEAEKEEEKVKVTRKGVSKKSRNPLEKIYKCNFDGCTASFNRPDRLRIHIDVNHIHLLRHKCPDCSESFACRAYLKKHHDRVHKRRDSLEDELHSNTSRDELGIIKKGFTCVACERVFRRKFQLRIHRAEAHGEPMPYKCTVCEKSFPLQFQLNRHSKIHATKIHICQFPDCDFQSEKWSVLRKHLSTSHSKFECGICFKKFKRSESLRIHEEIKHSNNAQQFACDRPGCTKSYTRESSLKTHQRNSHDEPKFTCEKCSSKFRHKKTLHVHSLKCGNESPKTRPTASKPKKKLNCPRSSE